MAKRTKSLLFITIVILLLLCGMFGYARINGPSADEAGVSAKGMPTGVRAIPVVTAPVSIRNFEKRLVVQGNLEARNIAVVHARVAATIQSIFVDEGDYVVAGKTKLFQIDALKLEKAVEVRTQALAVAGCALNEKTANLERVEADLYKANIDYKRFKELLKDGTVSNDEFERVESRHKQAVASHKHAQTLINLAKEQGQQAEASLEMAEKDLRDALVYAPISGKISQRYQEPGEMGDTKEPVLKIVDTTVIEVSAFLPSEYYPLIRPGETPMRVRVYGIGLEEQVVSYKSPTIHQKLRTCEIKCTISDPPEGVVPGAMAHIEVLLEQRKGLGVPLVSLQKRADRTVVFSVDRDIAHMVEVETGLETDGWVEIKGGTLEENKPIVTMGHFILEEGKAVAIREGRI
jgi:RND family efflux transporter MFP subunit